MVETEASEELVRAKLNLETSKIPWNELQRYFAGGMVLSIQGELDLVDVAYEISCDNKIAIEQWLNAGQVGQVTDEQALAWYEQDAELWAVVVRPWVLVQDRSPAASTDSV